MRRILRILPISLIIGALTALFFYQLVFTDRILARGDTYVYFYPYWDIRNEAFRAGELPLWTPDIFMGAPLLANPQLGTFYPLNWITAPFNAPEAVELSILLHLFIAGLGVYGLYNNTLGKDEQSSLPALLAAVLFTFGGYVSYHVEQINQLQGLAWMPILFLLFHLAVTGKRLLLYSLLLAMGFSLQLFTGHTQTVFITGIGLGFYALGLGIAAIGGQSTPQNHIRSVGRPLLILAIPSVLALILTIPQILPTMELTGWSNRQGGFNVQQATAFSLPPDYIPRAVLPSYNGQFLGEYGTYLGVIGLVLAILGAIQKPSSEKRTLRWMWVAIALIGIAFALGRFNPLYLLLAELPGFNFFRVPARWLSLFSLAIAMLAGLGLQHIQQKATVKNWKIGVIAIIPVVLMLLARFIFTVDAVDMVGSAVPTMTTFIGWGVALTIGLGSIFAVRRFRFIAPILLFAVIVELFAASQILPYNDLAPPDVYSGQRFTISQMLALQENGTPPGRMLSISDLAFDHGDKASLNARYARDGIGEQGVAHAFTATKRQEIVYPNLPLTWSIQSVDGFGGGVLPTIHYTQFTSLPLPPDSLRSIDGRLAEVLSVPECRGACIPDWRWLLQTHTQYLITDKVFDLVRDGVFYDTQLRTQVNPDEQNEWVVPATFQATVVDVLYLADDVPEMLTVGRGATRVPYEVVTGEPIDDLQWVRYELEEPAAPTSIYLTPESDMTVFAVTLVDTRTGDLQQLTPLGWERILSSDIKIYENQLVRTRAFVAGDTLILPDTWQGSEDALVEMRNAATFDPRWRIIVHGDAPEVEGRPGSRAEPEITHYSDTRIEMIANQDFEGYLMLQDAWYPGWKATVNGEPAEIYRANVMFRAVRVPAGESVVVFTFEPDLWNTAINLGGVLWLIALILLGVLVQRDQVRSLVDE